MTKDVNGMKKKRGRPALGRTRKLTKGVTVKFSPVSYEAIRFRARKSGRSLAVYIREAALNRKHAMSPENYISTWNRNPSSSGCISLLFRIALTAISSYCSTAGLLHSAHRGSGWFLGANIVIYLELPSFLSLNLLISLSKSLSSSSISRLR